MERTREFARRILVWFAENKRSFPWRKTRDPYRILVTEQLLRKTTAKQVNDIYETFFAAFPSIAKLAESPKKEIVDVVRPLGLQNQRANLLHRVSIRLVELDGIPKEKDCLLDLPGVGQYCADAIRCLVYGEETPMVDRNVVRVIDRVFSVLPQEDKAVGEKAAKSIRKFLKRFMPKGDSRSFNYGLLDFAAVVCRARNPLCSICPQNDLCDSCFQNRERS